MYSIHLSCLQFFIISLLLHQFIPIIYPIELIFPLIIFIILFLLHSIIWLRLPLTPFTTSNWNNHFINLPFLFLIAHVRQLCFIRWTHDPYIVNLIIIKDSHWPNHSVLLINSINSFILFNHLLLPLINQSYF